ncbi:ABC transporter permease [Eisenbergiella sp.]|uniref:ABC transporter permease n=1 Tax=Eisenbergiella sp. TaxID=1924109 RepID=UPI002083D070|nr:ABC transporter permease subunit [Eisenbergiella sp.]BDF47834.1 sugar ABC transporter permease [Lachnospiraceae bacterium]GKH43909.1 sugar ABC transporter permease [Lachnospiraceae bacterium]
MGRKIMSVLKKDWQLWVMILPALAYIIIFCYGPMYGIQLAFRKYDFSKGLTGGDWVGFKYFIQYFESPMFWSTLRNTFVISFFTLICGFPAPILLALVINSLRQKKWRRIVQTAVYMPYFISTVVMVALLQILLSPSTGVISSLLKNMHFIPQSMNLLGTPGAFVPVYVLSGIWQSAGWNSIIFIAALSSVDGQLYDAAKVDGANRWQQVIHVELPALVPTIVILLIMNMGRVLSVGFEKVFLMQNDLNLPVSEVISTYVFNVGVQSGQFSFGSAVGLFNTVINFAFLMIANMVSKKAADISLM